MSTFSDSVYAIVSKIPAGRVITYKQIACLLGNPRCARCVGNALHKNPNPINIPCHRVVNVNGELAPQYAFGGAIVQQEKLALEGVSFVKGNKVDLQRCKIYG